MIHVIRDEGNHHTRWLTLHSYKRFKIAGSSRHTDWHQLAINDTGKTVNGESTSSPGQVLKQTTQRLNVTN